ncbi:bacteriophage abortive infection AbiH family protein [Vibrio alginolyticus]|uniref:bacteriophage abortive infection AbiH family protein n=1 Tax=Vibrio alginolyticus TaxID=663 RepID=UPI00215BB0CB|nr:bacteriophage abortive infection AbiH family protein [Vibrio alginolyticus]MCR9586564.1 bacteriophage abortive infection AbiH family protein [Vibrio alginolyticus]
MKLYVIGNGFDLYHGLKTTYSSFGLYLKQKHWEVYELLLEHYGFGDLDPDLRSSLDDPLWCEFESSLAELDTGTVLEANMDYMPVYAADDFRDRDRYAFQFEMERVLGLLTSELYKAFKEFILDVEFPPFEESKAVNLDKDALYLNFNYTETLSKYYEIPDSNVLFIHEKAEGNAGDIVLGHGIDPREFQEKPVEPPEGLSDEEYELWAEEQSNQYDYSFELGKYVINQYFQKTFKGTEKIIENNIEFFDKLSDVNEVYVLGHSLAEVDMPYFQKLVQSVKPDAKWIVTYYDPYEQQVHRNTMTGLGITKLSVVKLEQI